MSAVSIVTALALAGGATYAFFSDSAQSTDNTFSTGNADLQIAEDVLPQGDPGTYLGSITGVNFSNIAPGFSMDKDFWLKNDSAGNFSMDVTADLTNLTGTTPGTLPDVLMVKFTCDTDNNGLGTGTDTITPEKSVSDWISQSPVALGTIGPNQGASNATTSSDKDELFCRMTASLSPELGSEIAGKDLSFDGVFDGTQVL